MRDAGRLLVSRRRPAGRHGGRARPPHRDTVMIGRTHGIHAEPTTFGAKVALWALQLDRDRTRLRTATDTVGGLQAVRRGRDLLEHRSGGRALRRRRPRAAAGAGDAGDRPRPSCRAAVGVRVDGVDVRADRRRAAPSPAHRGRRGARGFQARAEGLVGDAPQAQPDLRRDDQRAVSGGAGEPAGRTAGRRPVARAGHLALVGRASGPARLDAARALLPAPSRRVARNLQVDAERMRQNLWSSHGLVFSQPVLLALVASGISRDDAYRIVQRNAMRSWEEGADFRAPARGGPGGHPRSTPSWTRPSTSTVRCATSTPSSRPSRHR